MIKLEIGCYVDSARGIYATDVIVATANAYGAKIEHDEDCIEHAETCDDSIFAGCEFAGEYEDMADEYMNEHYSVDCAYWGRNEDGDWGLWTIETEENNEN